jgi:hypothetical protein
MRKADVSSARCTQLTKRVRACGVVLAPPAGLENPRVDLESVDTVEPDLLRRVGVQPPANVLLRVVRDLEHLLGRALVRVVARAITLLEVEEEDLGRVLHA